jgi:hypothetical protein
MAIRSKPQPQNERQIMALITKGGTAPSHKADGKHRLLQLRPEEEIVTRIDTVLARKPKQVRPSRHAWIIQAIHEKLAAEE